MVQCADNEIKFFTKSSREAVGVCVTEYRGQPRIDIRVYQPVIGEEGVTPTKKGISLGLEFYEELLEGVRKLGDVMGRDKVVARIQKSQKELIQISVTTFRDNTRIDIRSYMQFDPNSTEWKPTKRGISLPVELYSDLLDAVESLEPIVKSMQ
jgi:hypothetical protein